MNTSTAIVGAFLALGALLASSAHSKTAEARSSALPAVPTSAALAPIAPTTVVATATAPAPLLVTTDVTPAALLAEPQAALVSTPEPPRTLRRMQTNELTPAMMRAAAQVVRQYYAKPVGTNVDIQVDGKHFVARIERHYHPEGGPIKPWGFHPGVSLFAER